MMYSSMCYCCRFSEMPTNNYIESSFWNFDALFQPQQHPARDAHDTFFISSTYVVIVLRILRFSSVNACWACDLPQLLGASWFMCCFILLFFFFCVLHTIFSRLRVHAFVRSVAVARSSAVQASFSSCCVWELVPFHTTFSSLLASRFLRWKAHTCVFEGFTRSWLVS